MTITNRMITGFDTGCPILQYPYPNLTTATGPSIRARRLAVAQTLPHDGYLETATNDGNTDYNSLELALRHRMSHGLSFNLGYTCAHGLANFTRPLDGRAIYLKTRMITAAEMGNSVLDIRSRFVGKFLVGIAVRAGETLS